MRIIIVMLATIVILQACGIKANQKSSIAADAAVPVKLLQVIEQNGKAVINTSGLLSTENEARLSFKIGGIIDLITVKEGDLVRKGQLLASIKSTEISAQVQQVELSLEKAQRDYQRVANLYQDSVATLEQLQNAKTGVEIAKQNLQQVSFNQQYSKIYAPTDGFIAAKTGNVGELTNAGSPVLFMNAVSVSSKWILKTAVSDKEWASIETGNSAKVHFDAFPGKSFNATVSKIALAADPASGSFPIELKIDFGKEKPAVGLFASASISPAKELIGYSIPYEALLEANGKQGFVFVTNDQKTVKKVSVTIAEINQNVAYISDGLRGFNYVVVSGSPYLTENAAISVSR